MNNKLKAGLLTACIILWAIVLMISVYALVITLIIVLMAFIYMIYDIILDFLNS